MSGQLSQSAMYGRLDDKIREELDKHPVETWSLKMASSSHIKIYVGNMLVGVQRGCPTRSQSQDFKAPLAVRSQIRRAYAGITSARVVPAAVIGDQHGRREESRAKASR